MSTAQGGSGQASGSAANTGGQAPSHNNSQAGQAPTANTEHETHNDLEDVSPERLRKMVEDLRKSEAAHRTTAKDAQAKLDEFEKANLSELERAKKELAKHQESAAQATTELQRLRVERVIDREAGKLGLDPDMAARLIDWSDLDYDDDGKPKNVEKLVTELVKKWPNLIGGAPAANGTNGSTPRTPATGGGTTNPSSQYRQGVPITDAVYQELIKPENKTEYMARRDDILVYLTNKRY